MGAIGELRRLEGRQVGLDLADGSRLDSVLLISAGGSRVSTLWIYTDDADVFVPRTDVVNAWEASAAHPPHDHPDPILER